MKEVKLSISKLCPDCGFLKNSQVGVLKEELGLLKIIDEQILFPCHKELLAFNGTENTGVEDYMEVKKEVKVCAGFIMSLDKSNIEPIHEGIRYLFKLNREKKQNKIEVDSIMTIEETLKYHKKK
jgi:hypothetical protein